MKDLIKKEDILKMSYTDFVGFINQWNVLPGSYTTLSKWKSFSNLNKDSNILEVACTSGFSSRELSILSDCSGVGIDISKPSIDMAKYNKEVYAPNIKIDYINADARYFEPNYKFSHVIVGASLKFFPNIKDIIDRIVSVYLKDDGFLLASPFYIVKNIPDDLIRDSKRIFGIDITTEDYHTIMKSYLEFEVIYEDRCSIIQENDEELKKYCNSTINRACTIRNIIDEEVKDAMFDRLMEIKKASNNLRPYQMYSVLVLRYRSKVYPNRYTEIF